MASTGGEQQQYCLKWNNHRSTLFSVFDTLLEEESLVDVILSAEGQFLKAHRVILSACSPYFRNLFKMQYTRDTMPTIICKGMEFENLKSLVEYMYKGEANVPQAMLPAFIKDAEELQIRGLAECATKHQFDLDHMTSATSSSPISHSRQQPPLSSSTPILSTSHSGPGGHPGVHPGGHGGSGKKNVSNGSTKNSVLGPGGILAARLKDMTAQAGGPPMGPLLDFSPESLPGMFARNPQLFNAAMSGFNPGSMPGGVGPGGLPPLPHVTSNKKSRKSAEPRPRSGISPTKDPNHPNKKLKLKSSNNLTQNSGSVSTNNNYGDLDDDGGGSLKIDEDRIDGSDLGPGKENLENKNMDSDRDQDSIAVGDLDNSNGVSEEEEEPSMPGPGGENYGGVDTAGEIINPWTGGRLQLSDEIDENSAQDADHPMGMFPMRMDQIAGLNGRGLGSMASAAAAALLASSQASGASPGGDGSGLPEADAPMGMFPIPLMDQFSGLNSRGHSNMAAAILASSQASLQASGASSGDASGAGPESAAKYACNKCGRSYQHQATLGRHQRYECGIQASYPCDVCKRKFKRRDVLKGHQEKCVNKVQAQAALASMSGMAAAVAAGGGTMTPIPLFTTSGGTGAGGDTTPIMTTSPPVIAMSPSSENSSGFRPELHHTF